MTKIRWIRLLIGVAIIGVAIVAAGYRLTQPEPEKVSAGPARIKSAPIEDRVLSLQATSLEELQTRREQAVAEQMVVFENESFGFHIDYPLDWQMLELSANVSLFQAPDGESSVKVEAVGPLPADGLSPFVDRSLGNDMVISRQLLTVHGYSAERVVTYSKLLDAQVTNFYIEGDTSAFVITALGEQQTIEMIARSFNAPQLVAQR